MAARLLWLAAVAATTLLDIGVSRAASREFCEDYARAAIVQVRGGMSNRNCAGGLQGARWAPDYHVHFDWCLGVSPAAAGAERNARTGYLRACTGQ
jgi:hypothetical protein